MPPITRILIANRGEIARRIIRTADAMGIATVAVYADPDAHAPFVSEATEAVALNGTTSAETYLDVAKLLAAAARTGADAVHPGYGFLSENAAFARAVLDAGLTWIGPEPGVIAAMGDKLAAKRQFALAGVPTLPGVEVTSLGPAELLDAAAAIGYPVLVKAAAGGGGRGMRIVRAPGELVPAVASARHEAGASFADDTVFLEKYLEAPRHIEVQVFGDRHGRVIHLFERECSIQRRHQKVIEEAPSSAVGPELRERMGAAAVSAARAIGYTGAGTVEFLLDAEGQFSFLEMNTRLQVEHPVTEAITGLDLVREQVRVAQGEPLSVRQEDLRIAGHAIEARLYAEDPANSFFPTAGPVLAWEPAASPPARFDAGVEAGMEVSVFFDPMLAKVICHAPTREEAALRLALSLERLRVHGLATNRDFLVATLRHPMFLAGETTTAFIERANPLRQRQPSPEDLIFAATAVALIERERTGRARDGAWLGGVAPCETVSFQHRGERISVDLRAGGDGLALITEAGELAVASRVDGEQVDLSIGGRRRQLRLLAQGDRWWVQDHAGEIQLTRHREFSPTSEAALEGGYTAPMPGKVVSVHVAPGDVVEQGQLLAVLEAMKMEHRIVALDRGRVASVHAVPGAQVESGAVLVVLEEEEPQ